MSNLSRKSVKLKIQDTVRKIKVEPNNIINNIKKIIGKFENITYTDEEGDVISCLTEEELTSAVLEDGISRLVVKQKSELTTPNIDDQPTSSSLVEIKENTDRAENLEGLELRESSTAQGTATGELTGNIPQNGSGTLESQSHELKDFKKIVESWKREHNDKYGIDCEFTIETISGKQLVNCPICKTSMTFFPSNPSNVRIHFVSSMVHRSNVYAILGHDMENMEAVEQVESLIVAAKRYVETVGKNEFQVLDDESEQGDIPNSAVVKCRTCMPTVKISLCERGSFKQRIDHHLNSELHIKSKRQCRISNLFKPKEKNTVEHK